MAAIHFEVFGNAITYGTYVNDVEKDGVASHWENQLEINPLNYLNLRTESRYDIVDAHD